jgi:hypothetical protein
MLGRAAMADDLNPPPWRGQPHSTFQHWTFGPNAPSGAPDGGLNNPNGTPTMSASDGGTFYNPEAGNRIGVWGITNGSLDFRIPNDDDPDAIFKYIWIQVTWQGQALPEIMGQSSTQTPFTLLGPPTTGSPPDGWNHTTWVFTIKECPPFEIFSIFNSILTGTTLLIDQVVVDTICIVPSPGAAAFMLPGLLLAARRRR